MNVCLALHDFSVVNNRMDLFLNLKNHFPNFKVSLFTIAVDEIGDWGAGMERKDFLDVIHRNLDWMQIIPHALHHKGSETHQITENRFEEYLNNIEKIFQKDGLPYEHGFVAPHWRWNQNVVNVLNRRGWWGAVDRDKDMPYTNVFYRYNFLLNEDFISDGMDNLKLHGHVYGTKNSIGRCINNVLSLPIDTNFKFVTDCLEEL